MPQLQHKGDYNLNSNLKVKLELLCQNIEIMFGRIEGESLN